MVTWLFQIKLLEIWYTISCENSIINCHWEFCMWIYSCMNFLEFHLIPNQFSARMTIDSHFVTIKIAIHKMMMSSNNQFEFRIHNSHIKNIYIGMDIPIDIFIDILTRSMIFQWQFPVHLIISMKFIEKNFYQRNSQISIEILLKPLLKQFFINLQTWIIYTLGYIHCKIW